MNQNSFSTLSGVLPDATYSLQMTHARNDDGSGLAATAASGGFAIANTTGTSLGLVSEGAKNSTKTDKVLLEFVVPGNYVAGSNFSVIVNAQYAANGGTVSTRTVLAKAFKINTAGVSSSDLIGASAQTLTASAADYAFTLTSPALVSGDRLLIQVTGAITETANAGTNSVITVNSVRVS